MDRRRFVNRLSQALAATVLATHLHFGTLAPIPKAEAVPDPSKTIEKYPWRAMEWTVGKMPELSLYLCGQEEMNNPLPDRIYGIRNAEGKYEDFKLNEFGVLRRCSLMGDRWLE